MRPTSASVLLFLVFILFTLKTYAQTCTGSLGDPVIYQDFGSGTNPGPPLGPTFTNYNYVAGDCPNDGNYTIANSTNSCFSSSWHSVTQDHTGNPNGYMMVINASNEPGLFYVQRADAGKLCGSTTYEFAAWILNVIKPYACGGKSSQPNITFSIETVGGTVLKTYNTGDIPPTNSPIWNHYGTFFTTPANVTDVIVKMINNAPGGCGNDLLLDDITFRACGPVIQAGFGTISGPANEEICEGSSANYTLTANVSGSNNPSYQWQSNNGNGWADLPLQTINSLDIAFTNAKPGTYQYRLGVGNGANISSLQCRVYSSPLIVTVNPKPVVSAIPPQTVCEGNTLRLTADGGGSYVWSGPNLPSTSQNPLVINNVSPSNAGTYSVVVTSARGCVAAPVTATVKVVPQVVAAVGNDTTLCAGQPAQLMASGGLYYKWTPSTGLDHDDVANPIATPLQTTKYSVNVSNDGCNDATKSITVTVNQNPVANAGSNRIMFEGQSIKLSGSVKGDNITSFYWTPSTALDNPNSLTPTASPTDNITYTLNAVSQTCGTATSSIFVRVYKKIIIPNTFSPNNDGVNDNWNIEALITYPESITKVFDRYGHEVYQSTGYATPWNGTLNGTYLDTGTYYYVIDLKNNTPKIAGWVLIVR
jgi:gliding motility-associated-like protein